jgi:hypothetical protein
MHLLIWLTCSAGKLYQHAMALAPRNAEVLNSFGEFLEESRQDLLQADHFFARAIGTNTWTCASPKPLIWTIRLRRGGKNVRLALYQGHNTNSWDCPRPLPTNLCVSSFDGKFHRFGCMCEYLHTR